MLMEWTFPEFVQHQRGRSWYIAFALIVVGLEIFCIMSRNYTFAAFIFLLTLVLVIRLRREPPLVRMAIRDEGIEVDKDYYPWREMKEFWIIYRPPVVKKLYFNFKNNFRPSLEISLEKQNPLQVRQYLSERLLENASREDEPSGDQITRVLKI